MAAICRQKSGNFRVQIRVKGLKLISRTLKTEVEALAYQARITSELDTHALGMKINLAILTTQFACMRS
jgi:hypothetical protein